MPKAWAQGVEPADLPTPRKHADGHDDAAPWQIGFTEQTGQLEKSNDRTSDTLHIVSTCEQLQADALAQATRRRVLGLF